MRLGGLLQPPAGGEASLPRALTRGPLPSGPLPPPQDVSHGAQALHDLTPSLFRSWAAFWEPEEGAALLGWGGASGLGRRPAGSQTPWRQPELSGCWRGRPWPWLGLRAAAGIWCSCTNAIISFLRLLWLRARPGLSPGAAGRGSAPQPGHAPLSSLAPSRRMSVSMCRPRSQQGSPSPAAAPAPATSSASGAPPLPPQPPGLHRGSGGARPVCLPGLLAAPEGSQASESCLNSAPLQAAPVRPPPSARLRELKLSSESQEGPGGLAEAWGPGKNGQAGPG